jgi:hypothetical protein
MATHAAPHHSPLPPTSHLRISPDDRILILLSEWLEQLLDKTKDLEIRGKPCPSKVGTYIWLAASESSQVTGRAYVKACHGPLSVPEWEALRSRHRVSGERFYGDHTFAYELEEVQRVQPIPILRKRGSVGWQIGDGF